MTAEVVVMNKEAVALAADSAVTFGGGQKILNTANKMFMLSPKCPIGILLFNYASFMEVPWEIIIKGFRDVIDSDNIEFQHLVDVASQFFSFIENNGEIFVTKEQEYGMFIALIDEEYREIEQVIWKRIKQIFYNQAKISQSEIEKIVNETVSNYFEKWDKLDDVFEKEKNIDFKNLMKEKFHEKSSEHIKSIFEKFILSDEILERLVEIGIFMFSKKYRKIMDYPYSGVVFVGYGKDDLFPTCIEYSVYGFFCKTLVYNKEREINIGFNEENVTAAIIPFAQDDVVLNILTGIHPRYKYELKERLFEKFDQNVVKNVLSEVDKNMWQRYTQQIVQTIKILPKDDLASVARTLVNLTSFMRRVSLDLETVGGPVDVAVISKKDGFIWIDRKHYFDINKNPHYLNGK